MALGTALAIGASVGGSILGASATKKAANKAADVSLAVARENNALARDIYGQNKQTLSPYVDTGNAAMGQINALLGLGNPDYAAYAAANPDIVSDYRANVAGKGAFNSLADYGKYHYDNYGITEGRTLPGSDAGQAAENAFAKYRDSTGYAFRQSEGNKSLNSGYAARGLLNSGAAQKAFANYNQNIASAEFGNYLNALAGQQGLGLSGASALAGVGQNFVNTTSANNNSAGSAAANSALMAGQANNKMWGGIAGAFGDVFGSSFGK